MTKQHAKFPIMRRINPFFIAESYCSEQSDLYFEGLYVEFPLCFVFLSLNNILLL